MREYTPKFLSKNDELKRNYLLINDRASNKFKADELVKKEKKYIYKSNEAQKLIVRNIFSEINRSLIKNII
jgi:hypothetical protein